MNRILNDLVKDNSELLKKQYKNRVRALIRQRYSEDDELQLDREKHEGINNGDYAIYCAYVKDCIAQARKEFNYNN